MVGSVSAFRRLARLKMNQESIPVGCQPPTFQSYLLHNEQV